jgi:type II secretory pathway component GspD/PulD (secretin)
LAQAERAMASAIRRPARCLGLEHAVVEDRARRASGQPPPGAQRAAATPGRNAVRDASYRLVPDRGVAVMRPTLAALALLVVPTAVAQDEPLTVILLVNTLADDLAATLNEFLGNAPETDGNLTITSNEANNTVLIRGSGPRVEQVKHLIAQLDVLKQK